MLILTDISSFFVLIKCKEWYPWKSFLGCDDKNKSQNIRDLCEEETIDSMIVIEKKVFVFRVHKYWVFGLDEKNSAKPLGQLIEGSVQIGSKWKGIDGSKSKFTTHENKLVVISGSKWSELDLNGDVIKTGDIELEPDVPPVRIP